MILRSRIRRYLFPIGLVLSLWLLLGTSPVLGAGIKTIKAGKDPLAVRIRLDEKVPYKVVQFDRREILVAFRNVAISDGLEPEGSGKPFIGDIRIVPREDGVVSLIIVMEQDVSSVRSSWDSSDNALNVAITCVSGPGSEHPADPPVKPVVQVHEKKPSISPEKSGIEEHQKPDGHEKKSKTEKKEPDTREAHGKETDVKGHTPEKSHAEGMPHGKETAVSHGAEPVKMPPVETHGETPSHASEKDKPEPEATGNPESVKPADKRYAGTSDDIFIDLKSDGCDGEPRMASAIEFCRSKEWDKAYGLLNQIVERSETKDKCRELALILKAMSYHKSVEKKGPKELLKAATYYQDLISYFPDSVYIPYAMANLGKIHLHLGNAVKAEGYFNVVIKRYASYPGIPEIQFALGWGYSEKKDTKQAIRMLNNVITQYPDSVFSAEAKLRLGIARFNEENYTSAIPLFEDLMKTKPRMIEDSPDLLQYLGNAYYYTGNKAAAKDALIKLYNLYPGIEGRDTILTRVGDSLAETGQKDKAVKVYKLVQNKFPGTDGYVISTMRLAEYLTDRNEKVKMYNTIINDFAANPLARLAMLRLAMLQGETGDFEKSVETIKTLLASQPKVLKKDAMNLLQNSSAEIFKKLLEEDQYTELIGRYESDRKILEESSDPEFFNRVGTAYLRAHLYKNASDILAKAYYRTRAKDRSPDLVYNLAVSLDESGRKDESIDMLKSYNKLFPDGPQASDVNARMGAIFLLKENPRQAVACYRTAVEKAPDAGGRAALLISLADSQGAMGDVSGAVKTLNGAVEMLASQPEDEFDVLIRVFKSLGTYAMKLGDWGKAADSFASAIRFAGKNEDTTELYFRMGDAYMKARKTDAAEKAYNSVIEKGDSLWGGMAKERLRTMKLREKLDKT